MSASVRDESGIFVDFHFSEGGDLEFCSTFSRFQKVSARDAIQVVRVCVNRSGHSPRGHGEHGEYMRKGVGLGGKAGERRFTAEIATLRLAEPRSGRRSAGNRGERHWFGVGSEDGAMLRAACGEACDGAVCVATVKSLRRPANARHASRRADEAWHPATAVRRVRAFVAGCRGLEGGSATGRPRGRAVSGPFSLIVNRAISWPALPERRLDHGTRFRAAFGAGAGGGGSEVVVANRAKARSPAAAPQQPVSRQAGQQHNRPEGNDHESGIRTLI